MYRPARCATSTRTGRKRPGRKRRRDNVSTISFRTVISAKLWGLGGSDLTVCHDAIIEDSGLRAQDHSSLNGRTVSDERALRGCNGINAAQFLQGLFID